MLYSVVGFPRIGIKRELKFATEKYFGGEIDVNLLTDTADEMKSAHWKIQRDSGAAFIPSNDFSLYDGMLDTACMLNAIPVRYMSLGLDKVATYFSMARGYQGKEGDVKAFAMKKWFNTNYHYLVPELDDEIKISLNSAAFLDDYRKALLQGIKTKPVVIGAFTFLKLANCLGKKQPEDYASDIVQAYKDILSACNKENVEWLQIDEPYLVTDLNKNDIEFFNSLYKEILSAKGNAKILLQTYFGDVRDCYKEICALDFDGIGLDFVEGKQTLDLIKKNGFPAEKILFAGIINGKNIWKSNYENVLQLLKTLKTKCKNIVLGTSCSLLHVPYTVENETRIPEKILKHFSFACEKLNEMKEICELAELNEYDKEKTYQNNQKLFNENNDREDKEVREKVKSLTERDFVRKMPRISRQILQKKLLNLPDLPTTTIGSFPQTTEVKQNRTKLRKGNINDSEYKENIKTFIKNCIELQEKLGLDVLVHGEFERNDMVEFFGENLTGFVFTDNAWVQSYGTRGLKPPIVFSDVKREKSITTEYIEYANSLTKKDVKGMLTGPVTILNWSFPREDISIKEMMYQIGLAIRDEVMELEKAGVRIIQIDEAAMREKLPLRREDWHEDYLDFAIKAFRLCSAKLKPETQIHTHMCYSEFEDIIGDIDAMDADVITFEASRSKLTILDALQKSKFETEVGPGVYDIHSPRIPSVEEIESAIKEMLTKIPKDRLWVNPDCGLKTRGIKETTESLRNLVNAAENIRKSLSA